MAKCRKCQRHGLFLFVNADGLCKDCSKLERQTRANIKQHLYQTNASYRQTVDNLARQDELLKIVLNAQAQYKEDGDIDKAICEYEKAMRQAKPPLRSSSHTHYLINLYIKAGYHDKAWGYLNSLILTNGIQLCHIRSYQAQILKKENKHIDAILMLMFYYLDLSDKNSAFNREAFIKAITPSIKKLKWTQNDADTLADLLEKRIRSKEINKESLVHEDYKAFLKNHAQ